MRLIFATFLLLIISFLAFGQDKSPRHIKSTVYRINLYASEEHQDTAKYTRNRYYTEDGIDNTAEVRGYPARDQGVVKYDDRGNVIERSLFFHNGEFTSRHVYAYDEQNRMIEHRLEDEHTNLITRDEIEYDAAGNKIRTEKFDAEDKSIIKTTFRYDTTAHQVHYAEYKKGFLEHRYTHTYDAQDRLIKKEWWDSEDRCYSWSTIGYISRDEPLYECTFDSSNTITYKKEYFYTFDAYGHWVEKREYENDRLGQIVVREIEYYE